MECLPSLVVFGRCCVVWAKQLQQQIPEVLLLLPPNAAVQQPGWQQERQQGGILVDHSAARVCVPRMQEGDEGPTLPPCGLEELLATFSSWVGGVTSTGCMQH